jgi:hypothetical protein
VKRWVEVPEALTLKDLANGFANLNDDAQARFLVEVAKIASEWPSPQVMQWFLVGRHLRDCECSTELAREMVCEIARACREVAP